MNHKTLVKLIWGNIKVFAVLLLALNLLAGSILYIIDKDNGIMEDKRWKLPNYEDDPEYAKSIFQDFRKTLTVYEPFVGWGRLPFSGKTLTIDETGDRVTPDFLPAVQKEYSVHFFGGSTMWGTGVDDASTIPAFFSKAIPNAAVFNHGETAYTSRQALDKLINLYAKGGKPDLVIFYDGVNDTYHQCIKGVEEIPTHARTAFLREAATQHKSTNVLGHVKAIFTGNLLQLATKLGQTESARNQGGTCFTFDCPCSEQKPKKIAANLLATWEMAHDIVSANGGEFIAVLQPVVYDGHPETSHLGNATDNPPGIRESFERTYGEIKMGMDNLGHEWLFDFTDVLDHEEPLYIDFCHVSAPGNRYVAKRMVEMVRKELASTRDYAGNPRK